MHVTRRPRATGALVALVLLLALLGPGAAGRAAAVADAPGSLLAGPAAGLEQGLVRDRPGRSLVTPGGTRDDRERPGPALPGVLALAIAAAWTVVAARRAVRPAGHHGAATGARAPPTLQPAAS
jgi:hypothetical protein